MRPQLLRVSHLWLLLLGLGAGARASAAPLVYVFGRADFRANNNGVVTAAEDFNGDGRPDMIAVSYENNSVAILLGQADGSFLDTGQTYAVGNQPVLARAADFNGDGFLDLAVVNQVCPPSVEPCPPGSVSILLGNGDGTFRPQVDYETAANPVGLAIGDFDGDGKLDLAVAAAVSRIRSDQEGLVSILLGAGDGTFGGHVDFRGGPGVIGVVAGDFGSPGVMDLIVDNHPSLSSRTVSWLRGNGDGTFQLPASLTVSGDPMTLTTGDFNGDGLPDLAVASNPGTVSVLLNNGDGTFRPPVNYACGFGPFRMTAADLNNDGYLDLIFSLSTSLPSNGSVSVLLGAGDGTFRPYDEYLVGAFGPLSIADFNGDGKTDIAVGGAPGATVLLGKGDGSLLRPVDYATGVQPAAVASGDFNGDRILDLAVVSSGTVSLFFGNPDGTFHPRSDLPASAEPAALAVGDFNGDGKLDLVIVNAADNNISVLLGAGDGTFLAPLTVPTGEVPRGVIAEDFNGDGNLDLAVTNSRPGTVSILLGRGDGTFEPRVDYAAGPGAAGIAVGDFNGDNRLDLAVANSSTPITFRDQGLVSILLGNGDGTFQVHRDASTGSLRPLEVVSAGNDGAGHAILAVTTNLGPSEFGSISILISNDDGTFRAATPYSTGRRARGIVAGDFDADGIIDLAQAELGSNLLSILKGRGDGTFQSQGRYATGVGPVAVASGDFDGDRLLDAVVVNLGSNSISVYLSSLSP